MRNMSKKTWKLLGLESHDRDAEVGYSAEEC